MTTKQSTPANGTTIKTIEAIGTLPVGSIGTVIRRNKLSVTFKSENGIATVPYGSFIVVEVEGSNRAAEILSQIYS